jgi:hypothetical protein
MGLLYGRAGGLTAEHGDFWPGQYHYYGHRSGLHGKIASTRAKAQAGWSFGLEMELYDAVGADGNYAASTTAVVFLAWKTSLALVLRELYTSGECRRVFTEGAAGFEAAFGLSTSDFYAELNAWLVDGPVGEDSLPDAEISGAPADIWPAATQVAALFNHTTLCSDVCATALDGVCDPGCLYGSDCSDCGGGVAKPSKIPIQLSPACECGVTPGCNNCG